MKVSAAADLAALPEDEQRETVARGPKEIREKAKRSRAAKQRQRKRANGNGAALTRQQKAQETRHRNAASKRATWLWECWNEDLPLQAEVRRIAEAWNEAPEEARRLFSTTLSGPPADGDEWTEPVDPVAKVAEPEDHWIEGDTP